MPHPEEEMDVDIHTGTQEVVSSEVSKEADDALARNGENLKNETPVAMGKIK
jgi:hypothetical protein